MENIPKRGRPPFPPRVTLESQRGAYSSLAPVAPQKSRSTRGAAAWEFESIRANSRALRGDTPTGNASAPRKKIVIRLDRGRMRVDTARDVVTFSPKMTTKIFRKVVLSAIANAEHDQDAGTDEITSIIEKQLR